MKLFTPYVVEGIAIPGRLDDAKSAGFTDCDATGYHNYPCRRVAAAPIFGVTPLSAMLYLNGAGNFEQRLLRRESQGDVRGLAPEQLSYRSVQLTFRHDTEDDRCTRLADCRNDYSREASLLRLEHIGRYP